MKFGISAAPVFKAFAYSAAINKAATPNFWPQVAAAVAHTETIVAELNGTIYKASTYVSFDFGYGLFQLTNPFTQPWPPPNWNNPAQNATYAIEEFLNPAVMFWNGKYGYQGLTLIKCIAAEFNAGRSEAVLGHIAGDVDLKTTGSNYAARVLAAYASISKGVYP